MAVIKRNPFNQLIISQTDDANAVEDSWRQVQASNPSTDVTLTSTFTRVGGSALRIECNEGELYNGNHRSEVRTECQLDWEMWFSFSVYLPVGYEVDKEEELFQQIHAGSGSPPMSIRLDEDSGNPGTELCWAQLKHGTTSSSTEEQFSLPTMPRGEWVDFVYHYKIDNATPSNGFWRVWRNRELVVDWQGAVSYSDVGEPPYIKLGIYKWKWNDQPNNSIVSQRVLYYDECALGDDQDDEVTMFELMDPEGRKALSGIDYGSTAPDVPTLSSPSDGSIDIGLSTSLSWNSSQGADDYQIQVATDSGFSSIVHDQSNITDLFFVTSSLNYLTTYYWRVRAENAQGFSGWSSTRSFTTQAAPPPSGTSSVKIRINIV